MTRLTNTQVKTLRQHLEAGEALQRVFRDAGFSNMLSLEVDADEVATLVLYTAAHPDAVASLIDAQALTRRTYDFHEDAEHFLVSWEVFYGMHAINVVCHHSKHARKLALYEAVQAMREAA